MKLKLKIKCVVWGQGKNLSVINKIKPETNFPISPLGQWILLFCLGMLLEFLSTWCWCGFLSPVPSGFWLPQWSVLLGGPCGCWWPLSWSPSWSPGGLHGRFWNGPSWRNCAPHPAKNQESACLLWYSLLCVGGTLCIQFWKSHLCTLSPWAQWLLCPVVLCDTFGTRLHKLHLLCCRFQGTLYS